MNRRAAGAGDTPRKAWTDHGAVMVAAGRELAAALAKRLERLERLEGQL